MKKIIYLAGGCFWGVEAYYQQLKGVLNTAVGYANGNIKNPSYQDLLQGIATHAETVKIEYDSLIITLEQLLEHFLRFVNPYSLNRQGNDIGIQYRSGVYFTSAGDKLIIQNYFQSRLDDTHKIEVTTLIDFYLAEEYHQDYLIKNPNGYCHVNLNLINDDEKK